jgi:threonine dehydrogenase-like Zn-dependent dehydrogenase
MKAVAVFPASREIRLIDHEEPRITRPTDVKLRMLEVGVCGTDKEICAFAYGTPPDGSDFLILGHEGVGEVVEVGGAAQGIKVGDLVVPTVRRPCADPRCSACRSGFPDFCASGHCSERGITGQHGFMTEYVVDDADYMHVVPPVLRDVAVLVEPATIAAKANGQIKRIQQRLPWLGATSRRQESTQGRKALVLGAGTVGLLGALALRDRGFDTYVYDRAPAPNAKSRLVDSIGAHYLSEREPGELLAGLAGQVEIIYEAAGASQVAFHAMQALAPNSIFIFTGIPALGGPHVVDTDLLMRTIVLKNQVILGTVNAGRDDFQTAIAALARITRRWPEAVHALLSARYPLTTYPYVLLEQSSGIKNVIALDSAHTSWAACDDSAS